LMPPCAAAPGANCPRMQQFLETGQRGAAGAPSPGAALSLPPPPLALGLGPRPGMMRRGPPQQPLLLQQQQQQPVPPKRSLRLFPPGQGAWLEGPSREFGAGAPKPAQARLG